MAKKTAKKAAKKTTTVKRQSRKKAAAPGDAVLAELIAIKRLMIMELLEEGLSVKAIATGLGITPAALRRQLPKGTVQAIAESKESDD